jgi:AraC family transcriptional regulator, transcriptional activator of pobA
MKIAQAIPTHFFPSTESPTLFRMDALTSLGDKTHTELPHRHDFYAIYYSTGGEGFQGIDFVYYPLLPDTLYFISPGQVHCGRFSRPIKGYIIGFLEDFLLSLGSPVGFIYELSFFHSVGQLPKLTLNQPEATKIKGLITALEQEYLANAPDNASVLRAYLHILLVNIERLYKAAYSEKNSRQDVSFVRRFHHLVSTHYMTEKAVKSYAAKMGVSVGHLSNTIKSLTGVPPTQIIRQHIVLEAKRLLAHTDLSVSEIVYHLNLEDRSYFSRMFNHTTGLSPTAFRDLIRTKYQYMATI